MELLEMKVQVSVIVEQFRVQLIHERDGLFDVPALDGLTDENSVVEARQVHLWFDARLFLELFRRLFETLYKVTQRFYFRAIANNNNAPFTR